MRNPEQWVRDTTPKSDTLIVVTSEETSGAIKKLRFSWNPFEKLTGAIKSLSNSRAVSNKALVTSSSAPQAPDLVNGKKKKVVKEGKTPVRALTYTERCGHTTSTSVSTPQSIDRHTGDLFKRYTFGSPPPAQRETQFFRTGGMTNGEIDTSYTTRHGGDIAFRMARDADYVVRPSANAKKGAIRNRRSTGGDVMRRFSTAGVEAPQVGQQKAAVSRSTSPSVPWGLRRKSDSLGPTFAAKARVKVKGSAIASMTANVNAQSDTKPSDTGGSSTAGIVVRLTSALQRASSDICYGAGIPPVTRRGIFLIPLLYAQLVFDL